MKYPKNKTNTSYNESDFFHIFLLDHASGMCQGIWWSRDWKDHSQG